MITDSYAILQQGATNMYYYSDVTQKEEKQLPWKQRIMALCPGSSYFQTSRAAVISAQFKPWIRVKEAKVVF